MKLIDTEKQIINTIKKLRKASVNEIIENLPKRKSRQWVSTILNDLAESNKLLREKKGRKVWYVLPEDRDLILNFTRIKLKNIDLEEDVVYENIKKKLYLFDELREDVQSILYYAFTEMLNNAIEHSMSDKIEVKFGEDSENVVFEVIDKGIGVYNNIREKKGLKNSLEAIQELLKGKTTTLPHSHSGEGIFFTSKIADKFILDSYDFRLLINNVIDDIFVEEIDGIKGSLIRFEINKNSNKHLDEVFKEYQSEPGAYNFDKTKVHVKLYKAGTVFISRSQARRITANLNKFKKVILDFKDIKSVGQAFADEVFRVFASRYPEIEISTVNTNPTINFMIQRVRGGRQMEMIES